MENGRLLDDLIFTYSNWRFSIATVDGCEILHHQKDGWNMLKPYKSWDVKTTYQLVIRISSIHSRNAWGDLEINIRIISFNNI